MELLGGLIVSDAAIALACNLESRGHVLTSDRGVLKVSNGAQLSAEDIAAIRRLRQHLLAIAVYPEMENTWTVTESEAHGSSTAPSQSAIPTVAVSASSTATSSSSMKAKPPQSRPAKPMKSVANAFDWELAAAR